MLATGSSFSRYVTSTEKREPSPSLSDKSLLMSERALLLPVLPVTVMSSAVTRAEPFDRSESASRPERTRSGQSPGKASSVRARLLTVALPNRAMAKLSAVCATISSFSRPLSCTSPSGLSVATNSAGPWLGSDGSGVSTACNAKTSGRLFSRAPTMRSNSR